MTKAVALFNKDAFLQKISEGKSEKLALYELELPASVLLRAIVLDPEFKKEVAEAKKKRADVWFDKVIDGVDSLPEPSEVAAEKLRFDKLKYLAAMDNPEKYSEKVRQETTVNVNLFDEVKKISAKDAQKMINEYDPFNEPVEAEFKEVPKEEQKEEYDPL